MAISKRLRYEVLRRDNHTCRYCGARAPDVGLTIDHVVPVALGGSDAPSNLVTACVDCNAGKTSSSPDAPLVEDVEQDALRWARAMERAAQLQARREAAFADYVSAVDAAWCSFLDGPAPDMFRAGDGWAVRTPRDKVEEFPTEEEARAFLIRCDDRQPLPRPADWQSSLRRFFGLGLEVDVVCNLIPDVMGRSNVLNRNLWRYLCGACWRVLDERQSIAREILTEQEGES